MTAASAIVPFKDTPTLEGDGWHTLAPAYAAGFTKGASTASIAEAICKANGIPYTTKAIEQWIFGLSGKRLPFDPKNNPGKFGGPPGVGFAFFSKGNVIKLPDIFRPGLEAPPSLKVDAPALDAPRSKVPFVIGGALLLLLLVAGGKKKKS